MLTDVSRAGVAETAGVRPGPVNASDHGPAEGHVALPVPDARVSITFEV